PETVLLDNRDAIFKPHVLTLWAGRQKLRIVNSDPIAQNVAFAPPGDRTANIVLAPYSPSSPAPEAIWDFRRAQPLPIPVHCNYHSWELAYILPHGNPYSTVTDQTGRFELSRIPVGDHEFFFVHEHLGPLGFALTLNGVVHRCERGRLELRISSEGVDIGSIRIPGPPSPTTPDPT
ncbi:MAG: hypothetical protein Q4C47_08145, partial [Planctomycetia bacterium]|nr:hypothetical protein [Planctomycetia bacterium]